VKRTIIALLAVAAASALHAQTPPSGPRIATIAIQQAIFQTKDGQKALADIQTKFNPVKAKLDAKKAEIAKDEDQLRKGQNTMSPEAQQKLARDVDVATKALNRDTDDANNDLQEENQRLMADLGGKIMAVLNKYASALNSSSTSAPSPPRCSMLPTGSISRATSSPPTTPVPPRR
jgi:outer membrane protein